MGVNSSTSEVTALNWERVECSLQVRGESCTQVEEFKYLQVTFTRNCTLMHEIDKSGFVHSNADVTLVCPGDKGAEPRGKALELLSMYQLFRKKHWIQAAEMSSHHKATKFILRDRVTSYII